MRNQPVSQHNLRSLVFSLLVAIAIVLAMTRAAVADSPSDLQLVEAITGVNNPVAIRNADDGSGRLFIVERGGQIKIWDGNQILNTPFLDISGTAVSPSLISGGEQGLLGLAFHPNFAGPDVGQGFFYINYTRGQG